MDNRSFKFICPVKGQEYEIKMVLGEKLRIGDFQREEKSSLVKKVQSSIQKIGFQSVPVAIYKEETDCYYVIDGRHRLSALIAEIGEDDFKKCPIPILIVPEHSQHYPLNLNIEQSDNIKDKCEKIYKLYSFHLKNNPTLKETDILLPATNGNLYLIPTSIAYLERGLNSPSLIEPFAKKFCNISTFNISIKEANPERVEQAELIDLLEQILDKKASEFEIKDFVLKKAILSKSISAIWGRARNINENYKDAFVQITEYIEETNWSFLSSE